MNSMPCQYLNEKLPVHNQMFVLYKAAVDNAYLLVLLTTLFCRLI